MSKVLAVLRFLRIADENNQLSLTNLAVMASLANLLTCSAATTSEVLAFVATVIGYQAKRYISGQSTDPSQETEELKKAIADLQAKVTGLHMGRTNFPK